MHITLRLHFALLELSASITRIIGIDTQNNVMYGRNHYMAYMSRKEPEDWTHITESSWNKSVEKQIMLQATDVPDTLLGRAPGNAFKWPTAAGIIWGGKTSLLGLKKSRYLIYI